MIWLHRYARLLAAATLVLVTAGGMVTSTQSGLSVPDWPTTYGYNMFTFPASKMVGRQACLALPKRRHGAAGISPLPVVTILTCAERESAHGVPVSEARGP